MFTKEDGETAVSAARKVIEASVRNEPELDIEYPDKFDRKMGVFVTINKYPSEDLRGCIGYPEPIFKLKDALERAADNATRDPRFPNLKEDELDDIVVEVTLLTPPEEIEYEDPDELVDKVKCGEDGMIVSRGPYKGLLLPQVPVDQGWDEETFLSHTCRKAGLSMKEWKSGNCKIEKFRGEIYAEETARGEVVKREIG